MISEEGTANMKEGGKEAFKLLFLKDELRMGQSE